jgi:hypothetical protein
VWFPHLILLLALYTFGPGMLLVRPLRLAPAERVCVAVGAGLFLDYLLSFLVFANGVGAYAHVLVTVACGAMLLLSWRDWWAVLRSHQVRRLLLSWVCLLAWGLILVAMVRHYGGGTWGGDWQEHYERTRFLQGGREYGFKFIDQYDFPMRPPMMNAVAAGLLAQVVDYVTIFRDNLGYADYEVFQVAFAFLNSLVILPCGLLVGRVAKLSPRLARRAAWTLAAVLAASPLVSQNLAYGWTKLFAAFYALLAVAIYLRAWRRGERAEGRGRRAGDDSASPNGASDNSPGREPWVRDERNVLSPEGVTDRASGAARSAAPSGLSQAGPPATQGSRPGRLSDAPVGLTGSAAAFPQSRSALRVLPSALCPRFPLAFALLCVGFLVHFSVGPYALFLGLHYLVAVWWHRPRKWAEAGLIGGVSAGVLACWFSWSVAHYGVKTTFTSTSAVSDSAKMTGAENAANVAKNVGNTLLPTIVRSPGTLGSTDLEQVGLAGQVRDYCFLVYQVSLPGGLGLAGCGLAVVLIWRAVTGRTPTDPGVRRFWLAFVPVTFVVGTAVYGGTDRFGVAHVCLQPLVLAGLCLVAGGVWTLPAWGRHALLVGLLVDFALGVFLHASLQHRLFRIDMIPSADGPGGPFRGYQVVPGPDVPSRAAQNNLGVKISGSFAFWGDRFGDVLPVLQTLLCGLLAFLLAKGFWPPAERPGGRGPGGGRAFEVVDPRPPTAAAAAAARKRQAGRRR